MTDGRRQRVRLPDERWLEYREAGAPDGAPLLYLHGTPSAGVEWRLFATEVALARAGIRLIAPNRPGVGRSTLHPDRSILDWPADVAALLDHLDIDRTAVLGYSGGSPYALACAVRIPGRVAAISVVSGVAPFDAGSVADGIEPASRAFMELSHRRPWVSRLVSSIMGLLAGVAPKVLVGQAIRSLPPADAAVLRQPEMARLFASMVHEATHGSGRSAQHETALMIGPWGFDPADIAMPVRLWHGTEDRNAPPAMGVPRRTPARRHDHLVRGRGSHLGCREARQRHPRRADGACAGGGSGLRAGPEEPESVPTDLARACGYRAAARACVQRT